MTWTGKQEEGEGSREGRGHRERRGGNERGKEREEEGRCREKRDRAA